ncbi:MAG: 4-(cytidine 5'-diphospho)-2-C-methyl-D-erythritol kinase [Proteobacteria bacterium]|nr:4-(cytidine 5'-diphospho)-2-C-methyl-D-erythritol kinase [Pseudomonadota bacterium]
MMLSVPAPAKINLMLHITGRREDGYHELQTVFQFIDFSDQLSFEPRDDEKIIRHRQNGSISAFEVPQQQDIIVQAAQLLRRTYLANRQGKAGNGQRFGVDIYLKKNIPMGAGLGGGSSDAASTLIALNQLWNMKFSVEALAEIGLKLGADVPVFIHGFAAFAEGVGEKLSPISLAENWYLVLIPPVHVSTKEVFENPDLTRDCSAIKLCDLSRHEWRNVCTPVVSESYPMVSQAIEIIGEYSKACMSGTGASVFSSFQTKSQAEQVLQKIRKNPDIESWVSFVARGLNKSPLHRVLKSLSFKL